MHPGLSENNVTLITVGCLFETRCLLYEMQYILIDLNDIGPYDVLNL